MEAFRPGSLLSFLATVPDPRSRHGRQHPLSAILALVCCAKALRSRSDGCSAKCGDRLVADHGGDQHRGGTSP